MKVEAYAKRSSARWATTRPVPVSMAYTPSRAPNSVSSRAKSAGAADGAVLAAEALADGAAPGFGPVAQPAAGSSRNAATAAILARLERATDIDDSLSICPAGPLAGRDIDDGASDR